MKRFMFLSIGVLCLAVTVLIGFYVGSQQAKAQKSSPEILGYAIDGYRHYVLLANGDVYLRPTSKGDLTQFGSSSAILMGNYWEDATATDKSTGNGVKEQINK